MNQLKDLAESLNALPPLQRSSHPTGDFPLALSGDAGATPSGTYNNHAHFSGFLEMALPFALMWGIAELRRNRTRFDSPVGPVLRCCALLAIAVTIFVAIMLSLSRMGFLAALGALFTLGALALGTGRPGCRRWLPPALAGAAVLAAFVFLPTDALIARFSSLAANQEISADTRAQIWRETLNLIRAFPLFGCGLGAYESCFLRYQTVAPMNTVNYAHNDYLQIMAELGLIGFLAGLALLLRIAGNVVRAALGERSMDNRYRALACTGAFTAILLHSFVDFNLYIPANTMLLAWITGIAATRYGLAQTTVQVHQ